MVTLQIETHQKTTKTQRAQSCIAKREVPKFTKEFFIPAKAGEEKFFKP